MKIIKTEGCTSYDWTFDGRRLSEIAPEELEQIFIYLCLKFKEQMKDGTLSITNLVDVFYCDEYERDEYPCEQCGDCASTTTWEI
jgi:hypothetical protein